MTTAESIADVLVKTKRFPICCPANVRQVSKRNEWCASFPDRSILWVDYVAEKTRCAVADEEDDMWTAIYRVLDPS